MARFKGGARAAWMGAARRIKGADWWSLAGEFVMIVAGILIAFQLDRWAESWGRSSDRRLYLERLVEEAEGNADLLAFQLEGVQADTAAVRRLLVALPDAAARAAFARDNEGACNLFKLPAVNLQGAAMAEHAALPTAALLDDLPLRRAIRRAMGADAFVASQLDYFRVGIQRHTERLDRYFLSRFDARTGEIACSVDAAGLAADPVAVSTLAQLHVNRLNFGRMRAGQLADHRAVRDRARCVLARNCPAESAKARRAPRRAEPGRAKGA